MRIGCAHVSSGYNYGATMLQDGADLIADVGFGALKIWLSGNYSGLELPSRPDYRDQTWGATPTTLTALAQTAPYQYVFGLPQFDRIFLGTWSFANGIFDPWKGSLDQASMLDAEYTEIYNLCVHLLQTYSGKDFVLQTAESDWAIINNGDQTAFDPANSISKRLVDRAVAFYGRRVKAIRDARAAVPGSSSRVLSCIETNRVLDGGKRIHRDVLPRLDVDMVSWTSYEAINDWALPGATQGSAEAAMRWKTVEVVRRIREAMAGTQGPRGERIPIVIGEVGWPEAHALFQQPGGFDAGSFMRTMVETGEELGCDGLNFWQLWDNEVYDSPPPTHPRRQAVYDEDNELTAQGAYLVDLLG